MLPGMGRHETLPDDPRRTAGISPRVWGALGVGLAAFAAFVLGATPTAYPLDSAELATAAFGLGVAHPPGEETTLLLANLFTLLPFGSVAFKVALSQAAAGALAAALVYLLVLDGAQTLDVVTEATDEYVRIPVAAAAALAFAYAPGVVIVSNRAEVYAVQTALSLGALWLALRAHAKTDARLALVAALLIGLGVGNHSLVAGLVGLGAVTAALPLLAQSPARKRLLALSVAAFAVGLLVHTYLPLRAGALFAAADRGMDNVLWGDARTWHGLWWVTSAQTFAEKTGIVHEHASPWDLPFLPIEELGKILTLLAPAGAYFLLRRRASRVVGAALLVGMAGSMAAALVGGLDPANPDIRGYLGPAIALVATCSGIALTIGAAVVRARHLRLVLVLGFLALALLRFPSPSEYPGLRQARAADYQARNLLTDLPPRTALFTQHFETGFLVGYQRFVEGMRPDVAWVHLAFAAGPGYAERAAAAMPELGLVIEAYRRQVGLAEELARLDGVRPVRIEPDAVMPPEIRRALGPSGELWALAPNTSPAAMAPLPPWVLTEAAGDPQVRGYLAWRNYIDALWSCELGFVGRAVERFEELERLVPRDERFRTLQVRCR
ncbi:MAG TPA: DUF2723 domain-containing protein [Polyangia bacterium]